MFMCWINIQELGEEIMCPSHFSCTSPWLQLKLSSANTKKCLYEIGKWPHCWDAVHPKSSCCTSSVWGQSWKIECQIRFIQWVGLLINFSLLVQVQKGWGRADSQMGRLRSRLLSLNGCQLSQWPPFCALCCRRDPEPWKVISGSLQHLWLPEVKVVSLMQGCTCCSSRAGVPWETEPALREDRSFSVQE